MVIRGLCRCRKSPTRIQLIQYISGFAERNGKKFKSSQTWWTRFEKENNLKRVKGRGIEYYRVNSTTVGKTEPYYHQVESLFKVGNLKLVFFKFNICVGLSNIRKGTF